ncbi:sensor histidine kinase [Cryptosporangium phraense]|uniref:Oxygen sensor histidine kinase NreB n=1 Tax=Cryptosporangium phraense TaxID=2593070 RepID=A0A545AZJ6_9ACTN|nr:sensor histidine kinase [Cryptosporangium phraense]TQS46724.1 sensor histidine kinase [Cryptosporangium phraense]
MFTRPLAGVASALYVTVLVGGLYFAVAGLAHGPAWRLTCFVVGLLALLVVERIDRGTVPGLVARALLIHAVAAADGSGLARILFLLVPFAVYLTLGRRAGSLTALAYGSVLVLWTLTRPTDREAVGDLVMFLVGLVLAVAMAAVAVTADAQRARAERLLDEVAALAAADERNRVARDIHDSLGHHLTAIAIQLEKATAYRTRDADVAARAVSDAHGSAREALAEVRRSVSALRADPLSLRTRLAALAARLRTASMSVTSAVSGEEGLGGAEVRDAVYRVAQEGLTNAVRHAGARRVTVTVHFDPDAPRAGGVEVVVADDGIGLPESLDRVSGFGLAGMRERVAALGGTLVLDGPPGRGTTLTARFPAAAEARVPAR